MVERAIQNLAALGDAGREHLLEGPGPGLFRLRKRNFGAAVGKYGRCRHFTEEFRAAGELSERLCRHLEQEVAPARRKQGLLAHTVRELHAETVAERHLRDSLRRAVPLQHIGAQHALCLDVFGERAVLCLQILIVRQKVAVALYREEHETVARSLQFRRDDILHRGDIDRETHQRRRHVDFVKGTGHRVLAADRGEAELELCLIGAEQRRKRLRPSLRLVVVHAAEKFLEGQMNLIDVAADRSDLRDRVADRIDCAVVGAPAREIGVKTVAHDSRRIGVSL